MKMPRFSLGVGMRKIKSLLAILIGFFVWQLIRLFFPELEIHPEFIYIYGLLEIRDTSEKTKILGMQRIKATAIAIAIGLPLVFLRIHTHFVLDHLWIVTVLDLAMILLGTLLTLQLGQKAGCGALIGLTAMMFIIFFISHANEQRYMHAVLRASQTVIGVSVAWLLNVVLFPYHGKQIENKE